MNFELLEKVMDVLIKCGITPNLIGPHGIGKTQFVRQYAEKKGYSIVEFRLGTCSDAGDLVGIPQIKEVIITSAKGVKTKKEVENVKELSTIFATPDFFPREGKFVLFFDEWNRCQVKEIYQALFNLILEKKMNQYSMPEGACVILAQNPSTEDYDVFEFDDAAFRDRKCDLKIQPSQKEFLDYVEAKHKGTDYLNFLKGYPEMAAAKTEEFTLGEPKYSRRTSEKMMEIEKVIKSEGYDDEVFKTVLIGMVGIHCANTFFKFQETEGNIRGTDILNNWKKMKPKIEKISKLNKIDLINHIGTDISTILDELDKEDKRMTESQERSLVDFVKTVPKDYGYGFLKETLMYKRVCYPEDAENPKGYTIAFDETLLSHFEEIRRDKKKTEKVEEVNED